MNETVVIDRRFRGPPESANGGYACGVVAELVGATTESTLRAPPPLDTPLDVARGEAGTIELRHGAIVVAEGSPTTLDIDVPDPVGFEAAVAASSSYRCFSDHPYPTCFVCGPDRREGDGLRIFPGAVAGRRVAAAPWIPDASLADEQGLVRSSIVWASLDCPSWFGMYAFDARADPAVLLGRLTATIMARPRVGERCVAMGWLLGAEGRKISCGSALLSADGAVLARARATWIRLAGRS